MANRISVNYKEKSKSTPAFVLKKTSLYVIAIFSSLVMLIPFIWLISSSLKPENTIFDFPIQWIPRDPVWTNYKNAFLEMNFFLYLFNTMKLTFFITLLQLVTCSMAAYAFSKIDFPERNAIFLAYLSTLMVPFQVIMIPQFIIFKQLHLIDTHLAIILLQSFSPFGVFLLRQFFMNIPNELSEAARIDGLSEFNIYRKIIMPLAKPGLASLGIFTSISVWNDFLPPLIYLNSDSKKTIQLGLRGMISEFTSQYGIIMAVSVLSLIPIVIIFLFAQKYFVEGIAMSGLKG